MMLASRTLGGSLPLFANCSSASCTSAVADDDLCQQTTHTVTHRLHRRPEAYTLSTYLRLGLTPTSSSVREGLLQKEHTHSLVTHSLVTHSLAAHSLAAHSLVTHSLVTHSLVTHSHSHTHTHTLYIHLGPSVLSWLVRCSLK